MSSAELVFPADLLENPELAALAILDAALQQTVYALLAAHPELAVGDTLETCWASGPALWTADSVHEHIAQLQHAIERYRQALEAERARHHAQMHSG